MQITMVLSVCFEIRSRSRKKDEQSSLGSWAGKPVVADCVLESSYYLYPLVVSFTHLQRLYSRFDQRIRIIRVFSLLLGFVWHCCLARPRSLACDQPIHLGELQLRRAANTLHERTSDHHCQPVLLVHAGPSSSTKQHCPL